MNLTTFLGQHLRHGERVAQLLELLQDFGEHLLRHGDQLVDHHVLIEEIGVIPKLLRRLPHFLIHFIKVIDFDFNLPFFC